MSANTGYCRNSLSANDRLIPRTYEKYKPVLRKNLLRLRDYLKSEIEQMAVNTSGDESDIHMSDEELERALKEIFGGGGVS